MYGLAAITTMPETANETVSDNELAEALALLAETTVADRPKFSRRACRQVAVAVSCRNYAGAIHELCHMIVFADAASGGRGWEDVYWNTGPATAATFRHIAAGLSLAPAAPERELEVTPDEILIRYLDGRFSISFARMPFLSALLEFLVSALGYAELDDVISAMIADGPGTVRVSTAAKKLSRLIYRYLGPLLPAAQSQRNFRKMIAFLEARPGPGADIGAIDDRAVLDFWRQETQSGNSDFRTFVFVFRSFVRLHQALDAARVRAALERPLRIGSDRDAGDIDPDQVFEIVETVDERRGALETLRDGPASAIKFLNGRESRELELLLDCGSCALEMPVSLMRAEVFGAAQRRITQALRGDGDISEMIDASGAESYDRRRASFAHLCAHLVRTMLASLHVLARSRHQKAIAMVLSLRPRADYAQLATLFPDHADDDGNVVVLDTTLVRERFFTGVMEMEVGAGGIGEVFREARAAFGKASRQGFRDRDLLDPKLLDGFAAASDALVEINDQLAGFCIRLDRAALARGSWSDQFAADLEIFRAQFQQIYGGVQ